MKKLVNGVLVDLTADEIVARQAEEAQAVIDQEARIDAETARLAKQASGKQKLKDLGLDDDEIKSLMGV